MGELLRIHIPKCRIRDLFVRRDPSMIGVFPDKAKAEEACQKCQSSVKDSCPMAEPGVITFIPEEDDPV